MALQNQDNIVKSILTTYGHKLSYIEFFKLSPNCTYNDWNYYQIITSCGNKMPSNVEEIFWNFIVDYFKASGFAPIFNEINLCRILFEFWFIDNYNVEQIIFDYVVKNYGLKLSYSGFLKIPFVPISVWNTYRLKQLEYDTRSNPKYNGLLRIHVPQQVAPATYNVQKKIMKNIDKSNWVMIEHDINNTKNTIQERLQQNDFIYDYGKNYN